MEAPKGLIQMPKCAKGLMFGGSVSPKPPYASKAGRTEHTRPDWTRPATPDPSNDAQVGLPRHGLSLTTAHKECLTGRTPTTQKIRRAPSSPYVIILSANILIHFSPSKEIGSTPRPPAVGRYGHPAARQTPRFDRMCQRDGPAAVPAETPYRAN